MSPILGTQTQRSCLVRWVDNEHPPIPSELTFSQHEPHVIKLSLQSIVWRIGRSLLKDGLSQPAGIGDIRIQPHPDGLELRLNNATHRAEFILPFAPVAQLLQESYLMVPVGAEYEYLGLERRCDAWLAQLNTDRTICIKDLRRRVRRSYPLRRRIGLLTQLLPRKH